jgi:hypothetical protein
MSDSVGDVNNSLFDYWYDAFERALPFADVLRRRGNEYHDQSKRETPHVLHFEAELILDGRLMPKPVNYAPVRIVPPTDMTIDPRKRPFIMFDPRAGLGPGIGGMKHDSEIGVALRAGHPCYFVGLPGQTIENICRAEANFVQVVRDRHADADGKPVLIGNCQAGWQIMMAAVMVPELPGPIVLVCAPLSYWAGVRGRNPMRYLGGTLGGSWLTSLAGDLGAGIFDGAELIANFESNNPANTLWTKPYNLYSRVDTEAQRFLEFEKWWGTQALLNAGEMQFIVDRLFVGNKLTAREIRTSKGELVDLRKITSPIIVFCSFGDDITPPQQALGWILDIYRDVDDLISTGQTIICALHQSIGHLGIFVSGKVATKEREQFALNMELIESLPPGLYEITLSDVDERTLNQDLSGGNCVARLEPRTLDDVRALGGNDAADERRFETTARVSEINQGLYHTLLSPMVTSMATKQSAQFFRDMHPNRVTFRAFSDENPLMRPVKDLANAVRSIRHALDPGNPLLALEKTASSWIVTNLEIFVKVRETVTEAIFPNTYGPPFLQAAVGLAADYSSVHREIARDLAGAEARAEPEAYMERGGFLEAGLRALQYVLRGEGVDERQFNALEALRNNAPENERMPLSKVKGILRRQAALLRADEARAIAAIPRILPEDPSRSQRAIEAIHGVINAGGKLTADAEQRYERVCDLFKVSVKPERSPRLQAARSGSFS